MTVSFAATGGSASAPDTAGGEGERGGAARAVSAKLRRFDQVSAS